MLVVDKNAINVISQNVVKRYQRGSDMEMIRVVIRLFFLHSPFLSRYAYRTPGGPLCFHSFHLPKHPSDEYNSRLMRPISLSEAEEANFSLATGKSPSPNGFTSDFFHHCWSIIKWDVLSMVQESQRIFGVFHVQNATFLPLIPQRGKCCRPQKIYPHFSL